MPVTRRRATAAAGGCVASRPAYNAAVRWFAAVMIVALASSGARADAAAEAAALHARGRELGKRGFQQNEPEALRAAAELFKQALARDDVALYACDLALALHYLEAYARANALLARCLPRLAATAPERLGDYRAVESENAAAVARGHVAIDIVSTPAGATVSVSSFPTDEYVIAPTVVWLAPGSHTLVARAPGRDPVSVSYEVTPADVAPTTGTSGPPRRTWRPTLTAAGAALRRSRTPAYVGLGAGGALLAAGGVVHFLGRDVRAELATLSGAAYDRKLETWQRYQRSTIGLYAAGAIATGVGAWLFLRARSPVAVTVAPNAEGDGATVWWTALR